MKWHPMALIWTRFVVSSIVFHGESEYRTLGAQFCETNQKNRKIKKINKKSENSEKKKTERSTTPKKKNKQNT